MTVANGCEYLQAAYVPLGFASLVSPETSDKVQGLAFGPRLHVYYDVLWVVVALIDLENIETIARFFRERSRYSLKSTTDIVTRTLYIW